MKWIERKEHARHMWHTGPSGTYWTARAAGKRYEVSASWTDPLGRRGGLVWWSLDGKGNNQQWDSLAEAKAWCERDAVESLRAKMAERAP